MIRAVRYVRNLECYVRKAVRYVRPARRYVRERSTERFKALNFYLLAVVLGFLHVSQRYVLPESGSSALSLATYIAPPVIRLDFVVHLLRVLPSVMETFSIRLKQI